jgi:hypothetical protein
MFTYTDRVVLLDWVKQSLREAAWAPLVVFGLHVVALGVFDTYANFPQFDLLMHFFGGVVMAFFFHRASINASLQGISAPYHAVTHRLLVFTSTCTVAVFWEFAEFITDWYFGSQTQGGLTDTMGDLFFGGVGGVFFIVFAAILSRSPKPSFEWNPGGKEIDGAMPGD